MPILDKNRIYDGWLSLEGGVDAGRKPLRLEPNKCVSAENLTFRGGDPESRPGFRKLTQSFTNPDSAVNSPPTVQTRLEGEYAPDGHEEKAMDVYNQGIMQSAICYSPHGHEPAVMSMIGGRLFKVIPGRDTAVVTEIAPITDVNGGEVIPKIGGPKPYANLRNRNDSPIAYMVQADKWLIVQDGHSRAIIYDGVEARRSNTNTTSDKTEIPTGTILAYGMGRVTTIVNNRDVSFGDLFGSHAGPDPADSLILFTERNFLTEGFDASIPVQQGIPTGMAFFPQLDTSTGNGQLFVFSERGAASFFLSLPRELWKTSQFQIFSLLTTGLRGHRSISVANEDLWFRSDDGVRTYRQARSEQRGWAHIPLSTNVKQFINNDTSWLLKYASSIYFNNRVLMTCSPMWNQGRPTHAGMVVVDFEILSSFGQQENPAWEGHWTFPQGITITQVFSGDFNGTTRAFAYGIDPDGNNQLYEISTDDKDDFDGQLIEWELVSRDFDFTKLARESSPFSECELYDGDIWLKDVIE